MLEKIKNYIEITRLNKPAGILFLLLPCYIGLFFCASKIDFFILLFFAIGAIIMRSAGCVINDIFDRKFDILVARTKNRPLASGKITINEALILLIILLFFGLLILLQFNNLVKISGIFVLILVFLYPLMKRITFYPQIFLGFTFNFGVIMASLQINQNLALPLILLYLSLIIWTLIYDSFYAFQDIEDDIKIGVKSSAIKFKNNPKKIMFFLILAMFFLILFAGFLMQKQIKFYILNALALFSLLVLAFRCNYQNSADCLKKFKQNILIGFLILLANL